jgi:hypothetical protein
VGIPLIQSFTCLIPHSPGACRRCKTQSRVRVQGQLRPRMCHTRAQKALCTTVRLAIRFLMVTTIPYLRTRKREHLPNQMRKQLTAQLDIPTNGNYGGPPTPSHLLMSSPTRVGANSASECEKDQAPSV